MSVENKTYSQQVPFASFQVTGIDLHIKYVATGLALHTCQVVASFIHGPVRRPFTEGGRLSVECRARDWLGDIAKTFPFVSGQRDRQ